MINADPLDEAERIWPTPATEGEYRRRCPADFGRYDFARRYVSGKRVLDCASGVGYGSWMLAKGGALSVVGVDVSSDAIAWANEHFRLPNTEFRLGSATSLPVDDRSIEQIISLETLEHVDDPAAFIAELARVAIPGAGLLLSTPLTPGPERFRPKNPYHLREFDANELVELLSPHFAVRERLGQHSQAAARFADLKRAPFLGRLIRGGLHRVLPDSLRAVARNRLIKDSGKEAVWISKDRWEEAPVQIVICERS